MLDFPDYCSADADPSDCTMLCKINDLTNYSWDQGDTDDESFVASLPSGWADFIDLAWSYVDAIDITNADNLTTTSEKTMLLTRTVCGGQNWYPGDQLEAASPIEPAFWPIHPTMDRLIQFRQLVNPLTDLDWEVSEDDDRYEDWSNCNYDICRGHHDYDLTNTPSIIRDVKGTFRHGMMTNGELLTALDPSSTGEYALPYIYNDFYWDHCIGDYNMGLDRSTAPDLIG